MFERFSPWWFRPVRGDELDAGACEAIWQLMSRHAVKDRAAFEATLRTCDQVYIVRREHRVVGLVCYASYEETLDDRPVSVLYGHWFVLDAEVRAQNITSIAVFRAVVQARLRHPLRPVFGLAKCSTSASYLMTLRSTPWTYPAPGLAMTSGLAGLRDRVMRRVAGAAWIPERGVYRGSGTFEYRAGAAAVDDPHAAVAFYASLNPDQQRGDGLVVVVPCDGRSVIALFSNMARRLVRRLSRPSQARRALDN
jgi:hypothetical protein